jgi:hypothetical protein
MRYEELIEIIKEFGITEETVAGWMILCAGHPQPPFIVDDDEVSWDLYSIPDPVAHGFKILKAPKRGTPYAEYWPNAAETKYILAALNLFPLLVAVMGKMFDRAGR